MAESTETENHDAALQQENHMNNVGGKKGAGSGCGVCPIALLPAGVWEKLQKPPFRKRHPFIFWLLVICVAGLALIFHNLDFDKTAVNEQLALVSITGPILEAAPTLEWIRKIDHNPSVKGVLVRVDSPGGGAAASQEIYDGLRLLAKKMPMAISMGATAASGGLMVSMAGKRIFANPSTITGSIGVRMDIPQFQGLLEKIGIGQETLVTAPFKDAISYTHAMTPEDRAYLEKVLLNMHEQFINIVATGRHMSKEQASALANGKIFTGQQALELGLVDEMGGQQAAHNWLAQETGIPEDRKLLVREISKKRLLERLLGLTKALGLEINEFLSPCYPQPAFYF